MRRFAFVLALLAVLVVAPQASAWSWPLRGEVLRPYSLGPDPYAAGQHRGVDVAGSAGEAVRAPAAGVVSFVGVVPSSGRTVTIQTDGYAVSLTHLGETTVAKGATVAEGDAVGVSGQSGEVEWPTPYVHLGIRVSSAADGYVDPATLLPPREVAPPPTAEAPVVAPSPAPVVAPVASPAPAPLTPPTTGAAPSPSVGEGAPAATTAGPCPPSTATAPRDALRDCERHQLGAGDGSDQGGWVEHRRSTAGRSDPSGSSSSAESAGQRSGLGLGVRRPSGGSGSAAPRRCCVQRRGPAGRLRRRERGPCIVRGRLAGRVRLRPRRPDAPDRGHRASRLRARMRRGRRRVAERRRRTCERAPFSRWPSTRP